MHLDFDAAWHESFGLCLEQTGSLMWQSDEEGEFPPMRRKCSRCDRIELLCVCSALPAESERLHLHGHVLILQVKE